MEEKDLQALLDKYQNGTATPQEKTLLEAWYVHQAKESLHEIGLSEVEDNLKKVAQNLPPVKETKVRQLWPKILVAAAKCSILSNTYLCATKHLKMME